MILALAATRAKSIFILEGQLVQCAGLSKEEHAEIGYVVGERVMNFRLQPNVLKLTNVFAYGLEFIAILCFTCYCGYQFFENGGRGWYVVAPIVLGLAWVVVVCASSAHITRIYRTSYEYREKLLN